ncbi:MAG: hypothetical protein JJ953_09050 [Gracilimonas sp.]|uniref:hypothetical protein n=1 Tax=Gracilimonas TaxID=649462 RepID=UPI001B192BD4|nr:hypothetical protein [Gracilimonas sp.]MBO6586236.1 hypothetical protein [Gracilimonas sp.]MBO6614893.1 hypothetical protein [Gracilimonas sp.]
MKFLRSIFDFYLQSSIHVGLAVMALAALSVMQFGFVPEPTLLLFIWLGTICGYNFVKYAGISNRHHLEITKNVLLIRIFTVCCFAGFLYFGRLLPVYIWYPTGIVGVLTVLYTVPFFRQKNLRSFKGFKVLVIAAVWVGFTVVLPLQYHYMNFWSERVLLQSTEVFLFVIVLMLPFEIRDLKYDKPGLSTIPQIFGITKTKWLGTALAGVIALLIYLQKYVYASYLPVNVCVLGLLLLAVWFSRENQGRYYASFWVESIPIIWLVAYITI